MKSDRFGFMVGFLFEIWISFNLLLMLNNEQQGRIERINFNWIMRKTNVLKFGSRKLSRKGPHTVTQELCTPVITRG